MELQKRTTLKKEEKELQEREKMKGVMNEC